MAHGREVPLVGEEGEDLLRQPPEALILEADSGPLGPNFLRRSASTRRIGPIGAQWFCRRRLGAVVRPRPCASSRLVVGGASAAAAPARACTSEAGSTATRLTAHGPSRNGEEANGSPGRRSRTSGVGLGLRRDIVGFSASPPARRRREADPGLSRRARIAASVLRWGDRAPRSKSTIVRSATSEGRREFARATQSQQSPCGTTLARLY
jgi:hypothetical protein